MPFNRSTPQDILQRAQAEIDDELPGADARLRRSVELVIARVVTGMFYELYAYQDYISQQFLISTAEDENLDRLGGEYKIPRNLPTPAIGNVIFNGTNGTVIPATTLVQRADNVEFTVNADVTIASGTATAAVTAVVVGSAGNSVASTIISLESPITGITGNGAVDSAGLSGGADLETGDEYRIRLLARRQQPPMGGAKYDYVAWAKLVNGVTRVWPYPLQLGLGTVEVIFVCDNNPISIIPTSDVVAAVQAQINALAPETAVVTVIAPTANPQNFTIHLNPNTLVVQTAVQAELADFFAREAVPGGTLYLSRINEAIGVATGDFDHVLITPTANIVSSFGVIPTLGTITWGGI